jgi:tetratricopeptide (TPR) repeat protein
VTSIKKIEDIASWSVTFVDPIAFALKIKDENPFAMINSCNELLKKDSGNTFALLIKGLSFNGVGMQDSAISLYSKVLSRDPDNKYAHLWIAFPLFNKKRNTEAYKHLETAIKIDPAFIEAYAAIGSSYAKENQDEKAFATFKKATVVNPENVLAWKNIAIFVFQKGRYNESINYLKTAISLDSTDKDLYPLLAESYMDIKSYKNAIEAYKIALLISPGNGVIYGNLAWAYYLLNDDIKCIEYSKKAIETDATLYYARFNMALAHLRSGKVKEANRLYNELRIERDHIPASQLIGAIQDLDDLVARGIRVQEANSIINSFNYDKSIYK